MYFRKFPHVANFAFVGRTTASGSITLGRERITLKQQSFKNGVFRITALSPRWAKNLSQAGLTPPPPDKTAKAPYRLDAAKPFGLTLRGPDGAVLLRSPAGRSFGVCGPRSVFVFEQTDDMQFYGMGEKMRGLELSGIQTKFWNTDIFADFHWKEIETDRPDPMYVSVPYVVIKRGNTFIGLLLDNPHATFMSTSASINIGGGQMNLGGPEQKYLTIGAENGQPDLYVLVGPSLAELTRKLQALVGTTPLPPAWALGYHQCRWGYKSEACLDDLDANFTKHGIPCDGLWVDIDYMDSFKVFTFNKGYFPSIDKTLRKLARKGRKVIPIIDPGVKKQKGYPVYDSGKKADVYCRNPQGDDFVGLVWPGETVFPDFSLPGARAWWAKWVKQFAEHGFHGCWIDMNDPSTGSVLNEDMLFNKGKLTHDTYHNQYASGMAEATRAGFAAAHPGERPFVISRSGYTGISKHAAIWTGDNMSSYHYLRNCIAVSLNLALSGIPFNGPDIGGFANNAWPQLIQDWVKACFLFPFCRNHSCVGTTHQEPWAFDEQTLAVMKHYIQLRYAFRPYLYNLFIRQEESGEAIIRPLFYDFPDTDALPLGRVDDAFLTGPAILQGPVLVEHERTRGIPLPGGLRWFSTMASAWIDGGRTVSATPGALQTPLFLREGSVIPMTPTLPEDNTFDSRDVVFHLLLKNDSTLTAGYRYAFDDGISYAYRDGKRSELDLTATVKDGALHITTQYTAKGYGKCKEAFVLYDTFSAVYVNGKPASVTDSKHFIGGSDLTTWTVTA
ncbi:MAG TPA: glycoside hydrolase family 31 protein [Kiritimatiellia bacterium]|nr:glycoside hydrolase family 31 protein [Kiritimatiellia bacterium]HMP32925.1 glycoside hydrolase family 31 protein [Kiritimatiellia bacterium]